MKNTQQKRMRNMSCAQMHNLLHRTLQEEYQKTSRDAQTELKNVLIKKHNGNVNQRAREE